MSTTPTPRPTTGPHRIPTPDESRGGAHSPRQVPWRAVVGVACTALAATIAWAFVGPIAGVDLAVHDAGGAREVGVVSVIVSTVLIALAGGALLRWWQRRSASGTRRWTWFALGVAVLSLLGPTSADTLQSGMALVSLHAVVAAVVIVGLNRSRSC